MDESQRNAIRTAAERELLDEQVRKLIDAEKRLLRKVRWWHRFIPTITITWRKP